MHLKQLISLDAAKVDAPEGTVPVIDLCQFGKHKLVSLVTVAASSKSLIHLPFPTAR